MTPKYRGQRGCLKDSTEAERKILVAVDFGTTCSGLAWAQTRKPEVQTPIIQWPDASSGGHEGETRDKVPTELQYDGQNYKWGFQIPEYGLRHQWFKLDLDPSQNRSKSELSILYEDPLAAPPDYEHSPEKLTTDYLTSLRKHAEQILRNKLPHGALSSTPTEYVITVPAVWSEAAQAKTRACAEKAGMGAGSALHIVSEPEAAAMYALHIMDPHNISVGDTFCLCDAGGGTVDLISYTVSALKPTLKITEASHGSGDLCGSSFLNRTFQKFLEDKLGKEPGWDEEVLEKAMKNFETVVKVKFIGTFGEEFRVPVSGLRDNDKLGIRRGKLLLDGGDVRLIFEPVLRAVLKLVVGQIKASAKRTRAVVLVGGFGQNTYLRDAIKQTVSPMGVEVIQSSHAWTAVVRGALMKGLASTSSAYSTVSVGGRFAPKHYAIQIERTYVPGEDLESRRYWSNFRGHHVVRALNWFINKGDTVKEDEPLRLSHAVRMRTSGGRPSELSASIYCYSDPDNIGPPKYAGLDDHAAATKLLNVGADLSLIPEFRFPQVTGADGHRYYEIIIDVEITYCSAYTKYELIHEGINYGLVASEYV